MTQPTCVHIFNPVYPACGKPAFTLKTHGWMCLGHYKFQQENLPAKPRLPQPKWKGYQPVQQSDAYIVTDIIATDKQAIAAGKVQEIRCGVLDPIILRVLARPTVH